MALNHKTTINIILFSTAFFILLSCKSSGSDILYKNCVIKQTQNKLTEGHGVKKDIFKLLEDAETKLLESKIIQNTSKESYLKLTEIVFNDKEISKQITKSIKTNVNNNFFDFLFLTTLDFYSTCPEKIYNNENDVVKKKILRKRYTHYSNLMSDGFKNKQSIFSLINESETFSETERFVILHLILINT